MKRPSGSSLPSNKGGGDRTGNRPETKDSQSQSNTHEKSEKAPTSAPRSGTGIHIEIPRWLFYGLSVVVALVAVVAGLYLANAGPTWRGLDEETVDRLLRDIGPQGITLFQQYDRDHDNYLSLEEFEPLVYRLLEVNVTGPAFEVPIEAGDEFLKLQAHFQPLLLETMTKDLSEGSLEQLNGLKAWSSPTRPEMAFGASHFKSFLPDPAHFKLGEAYDIISYEMSLFGTTSLSSNRFFPPKLPKSAVTIHQLLTMFHPRPFVISRFGPQGTVAVVRAYNEDFFDIVFRIHTEFQLNEPPLHPFWFTPAQLTGHLIISRNASHVKYFHMYVPTDKKLNVDMEWLNGPKENENMEVDIGYMPQMEVTIVRESSPFPEESPEPREIQVEPDPEIKDRVGRMQWTEEISEEEAHRALEVKMYPFKKVPYYNFSSVFEKAREEKKLIHSILLWGALDDQSC